MAVTENELAAATDTLEVHDPASGETIGTVPVMDAGDVDAAVAAARDAFENVWGSLTYAERRTHLIRFRRGLAQRAQELADTIHRENGKPLTDAMQEVFMALDHLDHASKRASKALRTQKVPTGLMVHMKARISWHPFGVIGVIGPWNYPIFTPMGSIAYSLAAGNTVVFKPSELTPLVALLIEEIAAETLPSPDVFKVVTGDGRTGGALAAANVDKLAFTGSAATGKKVMATAAQNLTPVVMELGGKDPMIVAADADVDQAAQDAVFGSLTNAGQTCVSIERAYVVDSSYDEFVDKVVDQVGKVTIGSDEDSNVGPMTRPEQIGHVREQIEDALAKGATPVFGGVESFKGNFIEPIVLTDVTPDMKLMQEETFGPVLPIIKVKDAEEALEKANATSFGLGSAVYGKAGVDALADRIKAGMTAINSALIFGGITALPFGGVGESGFGRIHGDEGLREFSRPKATCEQRFPVPLLGFNQSDQQTNTFRTVVEQLFGGGAVDRVREAVEKALRR